MDQVQTDKLRALVLKYTTMDISKPNFNLSKDLGIDGDDAAEFLLEYRNALGVDLDSFKYDEYFGPEGTATPFTILKWLFGGFKNEKKLTIRDLIHGIETGVLNPE
jgi:hypothetical protein